MKTTDFLTKIISQKKKEVDRLIVETAENPPHPLNLILKNGGKPRKGFREALKGPDLNVIAEVKRKSPSRGNIQAIENPAKLALQYCHGGASAISVLTDTDAFGGSLKDLQEVVKELDVAYPHIPSLRKDFILHPLQLAEAVLAGASAVLLIARVLGKNLKTLLEEADRLGLEALTEVHDMGDLELALEAQASIIGVNHRNLKTFEVNLDISESLCPHIPSHIVKVAESGIHTPSQAKRMRVLGYNAILVGEALARSNNPAELIAWMRGEANEG